MCTGAHRENHCIDCIHDIFIKYFFAIFSTVFKGRKTFFIHYIFYIFKSYKVFFFKYIVSSIAETFKIKALYFLVLFKHFIKKIKKKKEN